MPDIRQSTTVKDDFERADENPIQNTAEHPWLTPFINVPPCQLDGGVLKGTASGNQGNLAAWDDGNPMSDDNGGIPECWGRVFASYTFPEGTRMGLANSSGEGYITLCTGGFGFTIRRYDGGGSFTALGWTGDGVFTSHLNLQLMRLTSTAVEVWRSDDMSGSSWTLIGSASDTTYRDGMMAVFGSTGNEDGWQEVGLNEDIWMPEFIRRPWNYQGQELVL